MNSFQTPTRHYCIHVICYICVGWLFIILILRMTLTGFDWGSWYICYGQLGVDMWVVSKRFYTFECACLSISHSVNTCSWCMGDSTVPQVVNPMRPLPHVWHPFNPMVRGCQPEDQMLIQCNLNDSSSVSVINLPRKRIENFHRFQRLYANLATSTRSNLCFENFHWLVKSSIVSLRLVLSTIMYVCMYVFMCVFLSGIVVGWGCTAVENSHPSSCSFRTVNKTEKNLWTRIGRNKTKKKKKIKNEDCIVYKDEKKGGGEK